jgi:hypothetical protein
VTDEKVDRLYGLPLDEFTRARNDLAACLKREGREVDAAEVKALVKPSVSAWAVNQLARERPRELRSLLDAGDALRAAQSRGGDALREALRQQRDAVARLTDGAREILREQRGSASEATLQRVATTLRALAGNKEASDRVERGRLAEDLEPGGFEALAGVALPQPRQRSAGGADRRGLDAAKKRVRELKANAAELDRRADQAEGKAEEARRASRRADRDATDAREAADKAAQQVADAEAQVAKLTSS